MVTGQEAGSQPLCPPQELWGWLWRAAGRADPPPRLQGKHREGRTVFTHPWAPRPSTEGIIDRYVQTNHPTVWVLLSAAVTPLVPRDGGKRL